MRLKCECGTCKTCLKREIYRKYNASKKGKSRNKTYVKTENGHQKALFNTRHYSKSVIGSAKRKAYQQTDPYKNSHKKHYHANKPWYFAKSAKRRAYKLHATPSWLTPRQLQDIIIIYMECVQISKETGIKHNVDHTIPLKGKNVSGLHVPWNLQIITEHDNKTKHNKADYHR